MKKLIYLFSILSLNHLNAIPGKNNFNEDKNSKVSFTENKGQVVDQYYKPRPDVLFGGQSNGLTFHLRKNGISYQLNRVDRWKEEADVRTKEKRKRVGQQTIFRIDVNWLNSNFHINIVKNNESEVYNNFYTEGCPKGGALNVKSYGAITYQNLYSGIDLKWYQNNGELKYDYLCAAGTNYKQIQLQINGAEHLSINQKGELVIKTPLGTIIEKSPLVLQQGKELKSKWVLNKNTLSFEIKNLNNALPYIIDPIVRAWGTYYGGSGSENDISSNTDVNGNVYLAGTTESGTGTLIATSGSHQTTFGGSGTDAFIVKFNSNGVRQWGTYYGGASWDYGTSCATDNSGFSYLGGYTDSNTGTVIATVGSHQSTAGGGTNGFLVKFDNNGVRQWGTYYGGVSNDLVRGVCLDQLGNVFLSGYTSTNAGTLIATAGSHQSSFGMGSNDGFLAKFNSNGVRQWGTYYGGTGDDFGWTCTTDNLNNVFLVGFTSTNTGTTIATPLSHQPTHGGSTYDGFLVKFNSGGVRQWGTYYGGNNYDWPYACCTDPLGNIYYTGDTGGGTGTIIATPGAHQTNYSGAGDAFLVKFDNNGNRQWGTYYGGSGNDQPWSCTTNTLGEVYLAGFTSTNSGTIIASNSGFQNLHGGSEDAFLAKFYSNGVRQWATYYGGFAQDRGYSCCVDNLGGVYLAGYAQSTTGTIIATGSSHQSTFGGGTRDAFLVKFNDCTIPFNPSGSNVVGCAGITNTLSATSNSAVINWYATPTSTTVLGTGTNYITPTLTAGTYTYYAEAFSCEASLMRTPITLSLNPSPTITVNSGAICNGNSFTIVANGANTYTFEGGNSIVSPTTNTTYTVIGTNTAGCASIGFATSNITVNPNPTITVNSGSICSGNSFTILPSGANTYTIQGGNVVVSPNASSIYTVIGTSTSGCISQNFVTSSVTVNSTPTITVNSGSICSGNSFTILPSGANNFTIQGGSSIVSPTSTSNYTVIGANSAGCVSQNFATANVVVNPIPTITAVSSETNFICVGQSATLTASGALSYTFNPGGFGTSIVVSPTITTTYTVNGIDANGCGNAATITQFVSACTGLDSLSSISQHSAFQIYPNPSSGNFEVYVKEPSELVVENSIGQVILRQPLVVGKNTVDISNRSNGVYYLNVLTKTKTNYSKIIKQ